MNSSVNQQLVIVIPTYNRARFLDAALTRLIPLAAPYEIEIFISDNCSVDDTAAVVKRHSLGYSFLKYHCNSQNLGMDSNFEVALRHGSARYAWLIGDTYAIDRDALKKVMAAATSDQVYSAMVVDVESRAAAIPAQVYTNPVALLTDLGWHMTCMSALVVSRDLIDKVSFARYRNTLFIHVGIVFDYLVSCEANVLWLNNVGARGLQLVGETKVSWESRWFEVWVDLWTALVMSLPAAYPLGAKLSSIRQHSSKSGVFSIGSLVLLRAAGNLSVSAVMVRWSTMRLAVGHRRWLILACALAPRSLARGAVRWRKRR